MAVLNNVNVGMLEQVVKEAQTDRSKVRRQQRIEGEWLLKEGGPQFRAEVSFEGGKVVMEEIRIALSVESDAPREKLEEIEKLAYERCPAVFALTEKVRLNTSLEIKK